MIYIYCRHLGVISTQTMTIRVHVLELDLSSLSSVYQCIEQFKGNLLYWEPLLLLSIKSSSSPLIMIMIMFIVSNANKSDVYYYDDDDDDDVYYNLVYFSITIILTLSFQATVTHSLKQCR